MKLKIRITYEDFYILTLCIYLFRSFFLGMTWNDNVVNQMEYLREIFKNILLILLLILFILKMRDKNANWILTVSIIAICLFIASRINGYTHLLFTGMFTFLASQLSCKRIMKFYFWTNLIIICFIIMFSFLNISVDNVINFTYGTGHSLGMKHPNTIASFSLSILMCWQMVYNRSKFNVRMVIVFIVMAIPNWFVFRSRTVTILVLAYPIILGLIYLLKIIKSKIIIKLLQFAIIAIILLFFLLMTQAGLRDIFRDRGFIHRFSAPYQAFQTYGLRIFGSDFDTSMMYFGDSAYAYMLISYGIIPTIIIVGIILLICRRIHVEKLDRLYASVIVFILHGMMEQTMLRISYNTTYFLAFSSIDIDNSSSLC